MQKTNCSIQKKNLYKNKRVERKGVPRKGLELRRDEREAAKFAKERAAAVEAAMATSLALSCSLW